MEITTVPGKSPMIKFISWFGGNLGKSIVRTYENSFGIDMSSGFTFDVVVFMIWVNYAL